MNTINLNLIHQLLKYKQYYYSMSMTNHSDNNLYIDFATNPHGMGNMVELRLGEQDNDIRYTLDGKAEEQKNINHEDLIKFITNTIK